jgi:hypothetical protein
VIITALDFLAHLEKLAAELAIEAGKFVGFNVIGFHPARKANPPDISARSAFD